METKATPQTKTQVYNLVILDISGTMDSIRKEANIVREAQNSVNLATERFQVAEKEAINRKNEANVTQDELEDIRIKMRAEGIDSSLEDRIASTERLISTRETDADRKSRNIGTESGKRDELVKVLKKKEKEALVGTKASFGK